MDAAIEDGVDVISYSIGGGSVPFYEDSLSIAAYSAIQKGIIVSTSAGNDGPSNGTLSNEAPWVITVGASTMDRNFRTTVVLGNAEEFDGQSVFQPKDFPSTLAPLIYPGSTNDGSMYCGNGSLNGFDVKGKVVMCYIGGDVARIEKGRTVKDAGGIAMIILNTDVQGYSVVADTHVLPVAHVSYEASEKIMAYLTSTTNPMATISFKGTIIGVKDAPTVTHFSSRGPSLESPGILKPDIIGPGLSILAAWPVSLENSTNTKSTFNVISGTSMSCPHLSGIAALLKKSHPNWSPAAIKSAIMTTADTLNLNNKPIMDERMRPADLFTLGAGHMNPSKANDPGLVYDIQPKDYIPYLCGLGYTDNQVGMIVQQTVTCSQITSIEQAQLNYPSFAINLSSGNKTYTRTVTNVGPAQSTYSLSIYTVPELGIEVNPTSLAFTSINQQITYQITFKYSNIPVISPHVEGAIEWSDGKGHVVRSPISVQLP
ncbi:hypothetical protein Leryth_008897 [Lithospermum erythrorhizon]|nr:hypothetical protein Leryth_008897 [Lithospermum erythrorhizon]